MPLRHYYILVLLFNKKLEFFFNQYNPSSTSNNTQNGYLNIKCRWLLTSTQHARLGNASRREGWALWWIEPWAHFKISAFKNLKWLTWSQLTGTSPQISGKSCYISDKLAINCQSHANIGLSKFLPPLIMLEAANRQYYKIYHHNIPTLPTWFEAWFFFFLKLIFSNTIVYAFPFI